MLSSLEPWSIILILIPAFAKALKTQNKALQKAFSTALDKLSSKKTQNSDFFFYKNFENTFENILSELPNEYRNEVKKLIEV